MDADAIGPEAGPLKQTIDVRLSVSDWLLLMGWCSGHVTDSTPRVIEMSIYAIGKQVHDGVR